MRSQLTPGLYTRCFKDETFTPKGESPLPFDASEPWCARCDEEGDEPGIAEIVEVSNCPDPGICASSEHHFALNQHVSEV